MQDTTWRARQLYGNEPEIWDFAASPPADLVLLNIRTKDHKNGSATLFRQTYDSFVGKIHGVWLKANIVLMSLTNAHRQKQGSWVQNSFFKDDILAVYNKYKSEDFVHYFDTKGIMQHNDIVRKHLIL